MSQPSFYSEGIRPLPSDTQLKVWTKILGRVQNAAGASARNNPQRDDTLWDITFKLARAVGSDPPPNIALIPLQRRVYSAIRRGAGGVWPGSNVYTYNGKPDGHVSASGTAVVLTVVSDFVRLYIKFTDGTSADEWVYETNFATAGQCCSVEPAPPPEEPPIAPTIEGTYDESGDLIAVRIIAGNGVDGLDNDGTYQIWGNVTGILHSYPVSPGVFIIPTPEDWPDEDTVWVVEVGNGIDYVGSSDPSNSLDTSNAPPAEQVTWDPPNVSANWTDGGGAHTGDMATFNAIADLGTVTSFTITGEGITSISNLDLMPSLQTLNLSGNNLTAVDLSGLIALADLFLANNDFVTLDLNNGSSGYSSVDISGCTALTTLSATTVTSVSGDFTGSGCVSLTALTLAPTLSMGGTIDFNGCNSLTTVSCASGSWSGSGGNVFIYNCPALTTLNISSLTMANAGQTIAFGACALDEASVDAVLHRCVVSGLTTVGINLDGGTNSPPSVTGQADATTLTNDGCSVTTN